MTPLKRSFLTPLFLLVAGIWLIIHFTFFKDLYFMGADVTQWQGDWKKLTQCLVDSLESCREVGISKFPLGYLLNAGILAMVAPIGGTLKTQMGIINFSVLLLPIVIAFITKPFLIALRIAALYTMVLLCSPLPAFYISSGALEVQSGVLIGILITSAYYLLFERCNRMRRAALYGFLIISALLVPLYKDTNLPILLGALIIFTGLFIFYQKKGSKHLTEFRVRTAFLLGFYFS